MWEVVCPVHGLHRVHQQGQPIVCKRKVQFSRRLVRQCRKRLVSAIRTGKPKRLTKNSEETLTGPGQLCDVELDFLEQYLALIDAQLERLSAEGKESGDPDAFGVIDDVDSLIGLGFIACQRYLTATCSRLKVPKQVGLTAGPKHSSGMTTAQIIDHAANYWKHHEEWRGQQTSSQKERTEAAMEAINALDSDYPMMTALSEITMGTKFKDTLPDLAWWRDDLVAQAT